MSDICTTISSVETVTKRDLNQRTSAVLDQVIETGEVIVTERGEPRWRVSAYRSQDAPLARAERQGRYTPPASTPAPWPNRPGGPAYESDDVEALLIRMPEIGTPQCFLLPIDTCYEFVGGLRSLWRGFDGGTDVHAFIDGFFGTIGERAKDVPP